MKKSAFNLFIFLLIIFGTSIINAQIGPKLINPKNIDTCQSKLVTFNWEDIQLAESYRIEVSDTSDFSNLIISQDGITDNTININFNSWNKTYYWRVYAIYNGGTEGKSLEFLFRTKKAPVTLVQIPNAATCIDTAAIFKWNKSDAEFYIMQIATDSNFDNIIIVRNSIYDTTFKTQLTEFNTKYYWRVASQKGMCITDWSDVWSFTTLPVTVNLATPANNSRGTEIFENQPFTTQLNWHPVANATSYDIEVSKKATFDTVFAASYETTDTAFTLNAGTELNTYYYWRVRANENTCKGYWSAANRLVTPYIKTNLVLPINNETCVSLKHNLFKWDAIPSTLAYRIQISTTPEFDSIIVDSANISTIQASFNLIDYPLTTLFWRVRAEDTHNIGLWSEIFDFSTTQRPPNSFIPANNTVGSNKNLELSWENFGEFTFYDLKITKNDSLKTIILDTTLLDTNRLKIIVPDNNTQYLWAVKVRTGLCISDWSDFVSFKTILSAPQLISPTYDSLISTLYPDFKWNTVEDAIFYDIEVSMDSNFTTIYKTFRNISSNEVTFAGDPFLPLNTYFWRVRAKNNDGASNWSEYFKFSINAQRPAPPVLIEPVNFAIKQEFELDLKWNLIDSLEYFIEIATDSDFFNKIHSSNTTEGILHIDSLDRFTTYYWRIRAKNDGGFSDWSQVFRFRTKDIAPTEIPVLVFPENFSTDQDFSFTFVWRPVERALGYIIEVSKSSLFEPENVFFRYDKVWETSKSISGLEHNTQFYWRVKAWNEDGEAAWTEPFNFKTKIQSSINEQLFSGYNIKFGPNPIENNIAYINFNLPKTQKVSIEIYDILGNKLIKTDTKYYSYGSNTIELNLNKLNTGTYYYIINFDNTQYKNSFVIK